MSLSSSGVIKGCCKKVSSAPHTCCCSPREGGGSFVQFRAHLFSRYILESLLYPPPPSPSSNFDPLGHPSAKSRERRRRRRTLPLHKFLSSYCTSLESLKGFLHLFLLLRREGPPLSKSSILPNLSSSFSTTTTTSTSTTCLSYSPRPLLGRICARVGGEGGGERSPIHLYSLSLSLTHTHTWVGGRRLKGGRPH